jgi:hypothetical protein
MFQTIVVITAASVVANPFVVAMDVRSLRVPTAILVPMRLSRRRLWMPRWCRTMGWNMSAPTELRPLPYPPPPRCATAGREKITTAARNQKSFFILFLQKSCPNQRTRFARSPEDNRIVGAVLLKLTLSGL